MVKNYQKRHPAVKFIVKYAKKVRPDKLLVRLFLFPI
jgi:hypothetical protein